MAQQGNVYTSHGEVKLSQAQYRLSDEVVDSQCECSTCKTYSRGYLHHLTKCRETLGWRALALHNIYFYQKLMKNIRVSIAENRFIEYYRSCLASWHGSEEVLDVEFSREPSVIIHVKKKTRGQFINQ